MVWCQAVSITAQCGTPGSSARAASMPRMFGGLCSGARPASSLKAARAASSMTTDWAKCSPPCTTRCPTALIWERSAMAPASGWVSMDRTSSRATLWFGQSCSFFTLPLPRA